MDSNVNGDLSGSIPPQIPEKLDVMARRACVELQHTNTRRRQSLVYTIPFELLSLIFQDCDRPLSLSQVSRLFRSVAIDTPILWAQISHVVGRDSGCDIPRTSEYLRRSKRSPLKITLHTGEYCHEDDARDIPELFAVLDLLIPHVHRWEEFELHSGALSGPGICIARLANAAAPNLRRLFIDIWGGEDSNSLVLTESTIFGLGTHHLTSVKLWGIPPLYCLPPLGSATRLHIRDLKFSTSSPFSSLFSTLSGASHLTHLSLEQIDCGIWPSPHIIHLPSLIFLAISPSDEEDLLAGILNALVAPLLQSLILDGVTDGDLAMIFSRAAKLSRTFIFPLVRFLTIGFFKAETGSGNGFDEGMLNQFATVFPIVTHFTLRDIDPTQNSMSELRTSASLSFQHLRTFTWSMVELSAHEQSVVASVLSKFITKRYKAGIGIQLLRVTQDILDGVTSGNRMGNLGRMIDRIEVCELPKNLTENWLDI